jgi:hypothetical protein
LPIPVRAQVDYWDEALRGLGCRVSEGGVRSWVLAYRFNGRTRRWTIGRYPDIDRARDQVLTTQDIRTFWAAVDEQGGLVRLHRDVL